MIEQHVKHSKKILAFLALVLALVTGISGTLMLLTDITPTATNVMTAGNVDVKLFEDIKQTESTEDLSTVDVTEDKTITTLPAILPSGTIVKQPYVKNTGTTNAYVAIELIFWTGGTAGASESAPGNNTVALAEDFFDEINFSDTWTRDDSNDWTTTSTVSGESSGLVEHHTVLFYGSGSGATLTPLPVDTGSTSHITPKVFTEIDIPEAWGNEIDDVQFNLAVKAYAIQASNVTPGTDATAWLSFFHTQFPLLNEPSTTP